MAWRPWRLWRDIRMQNQILVARVIVPLVLATATLCTGGYVVGRTAVSLRVHYLFDQQNPMNPVRWWEAVSEGILFPRSSASLVVARPGGGTTSFPSSYSFTHRSSSLNKAGSVEARSVFDRIAMAVWLIAFAFLFQTFCAGAFAALPASLRRAKVRYAHIVRVWAYSLYLLLPPIALTALSFASTIVWLRLGWYAMVASLVASAFAVPAMTIVFWRFALSRYLRLPQSWQVLTAIVAIAALASALSFYLIAQPGSIRDVTFPVMYQRIIRGIWS